MVAGLIVFIIGLVMRWGLPDPAWGIRNVHEMGLVLMVVGTVVFVVMAVVYVLGRPRDGVEVGVLHEEREVGEPLPEFDPQIEREATRVRRQRRRYYR